MRKIKEKLWCLIAGIGILTSCATIKPIGSIEIAYVPKRIDDHIEGDKIKLSLDTRLEFPTRIGDFYIGFIGTGYGRIDFNDDNKGLNPHRIESTGYAGWREKTIWRFMQNIIQIIL